MKSRRNEFVDYYSMQKKIAFMIILSECSIVKSIFTGAAFSEIGVVKAQILKWLTLAYFNYSFYLAAKTKASLTKDFCPHLDLFLVQIRSICVTGRFAFFFLLVVVCLFVYCSCSIIDEKRHYIGHYINTS